MTRQRSVAESIVFRHGWPRNADSWEAQMLFLASNGGRHGTTCVAKVAIVSAMLPLMVNTAASPGGLPIELFDGIRAGSIADCWQLCKELARGH